MHFFEDYASDTLAGSANQTLFDGGGQVKRGRVYYKLFCGGETAYALLFSGTVDSTFADGRRSTANALSDVWKIFEIRAGLCASCDMETAVQPETMHIVTFEGERQKTVYPGQTVHSDPLPLTARAGEYLCLDITFGGHRMPCHEELWVASFVQEDNLWRPSAKLPVPLMIGAKRQPRYRVGFLGDSITQGIGSTKNSYAHWAAVLASKLGTDDAFWNLGIGYGRAADVATDGTWLERAKQNDVVVLCLGVNDLLQGADAAGVIDSLTTIIERLQERGIRVLLQSVPPFEFSESVLTAWKAVNAYIESTLSDVADGYFDNTVFLCDGDRPRYGGHPNDEGNAVWAQRLYEYMEPWLPETKRR